MVTQRVAYAGVNVLLKNFVTIQLQSGVLSVPEVSLYEKGIRTAL